MRLNFGCGQKPLAGFVNCDMIHRSHVDKVFDLDIKTPYPFPNNSADEIRMTYVLEHLHHPEHCLNECHRILKPGGVLVLGLPHYTCATGYREFHHHQYSAYAFGVHDWQDMKFVKERVFLKFKRQFFYESLCERLFNKGKMLWVYELSLFRLLFPAYTIWFWLRKSGER